MNKIFIFSLGVLTGSLITWKIIAEKEHKRADEEIAQTKEVLYRNAKKKQRVEEKAVEKPEEEYCTPREGTEEEIRDYSDALNRLGYLRDMDKDVERKEPRPVDSNRIYVISPDDFDTYDDYDTVSLTYYADGVLTYESNVPVDADGTPYEEIIGDEALDSFGEYEDDSVFVRNEFLMIDYEILLDTRNYNDVVK